MHMIRRLGSDMFPRVAEFTTIGIIAFAMGCGVMYYVDHSYPTLFGTPTPAAATSTPVSNLSRIKSQLHLQNVVPLASVSTTSAGAPATVSTQVQSPVVQGAATVETTPSSQSTATTTTLEHTVKFIQHLYSEIGRFI